MEAPALPVGEAAALGCAACWTFSSIAFTAAARRAGASPVNQARLLLACAYLGAAWLALGGTGAADGTPPARQTVLLAASGVVGLTLGDAALFRAWTILGARRVAVLQSLAPLFVAALAAGLLGETLEASGVVGILLTLAGVVWVVVDRTHPHEAAHGSVREGVVLAVLAAAGQAAGGVLTKAGLGQVAAESPLGALAAGAGAAPAPVSPLLGTLIRMGVGCAALLLFTVPTGRAAKLRTVVRDPVTLRWTAAGAVFGPFVGVWLSLVAFASTQAAVAQTLMSLTPVLVLPANRVLTGERAGPRAYGGAALAVLGVVVLAFRHRLAW